ncbi:DMT family transporter [Vibrio sp.]|uniref:EamA/RhaT family transporter n=1 Tax=Vibrio viridaestus TaxID=2487322 RepID=A0A3N9TZC8_9VIBR|nr:DMT family transporter [Vibrio viridaestus]MDC0609165.1 DMT family transporter [Vibrio sp.]RQW62322.1 EamA/RhaT family transporter [Vibrio viridaestus]
MNRHQKILSLLLLTGIAGVWGTSYGITKPIVAMIPVFLFLCVRFGLTCLILYPAVWRSMNRDSWKIFSPSGLILFAIFICETIGVMLTTASKAAFLISLFIVFTPLSDKLLNRSIIPTSTWFSVLIAIFGMYLLSLDSSQYTNINLGDVLMILAAILRGIMVAFMKRITHQHRSSALVITFVQSSWVFGGCLVVLSWQIFMQQNIHWLNLASLDQMFWIYMGYLVIFCTLFAFFAQNYSIKHISPSLASVVLGLEPIFGALFAYLWLHEILTATQYLGAVCIVIATFVMIIASSFDGTKRISRQTLRQNQHTVEQ